MSLKARLAAGDTLLGTFLKTPSPILVEVLAATGLDLLCLDAEHAPFDRHDLDLCILAARGAGLPIIVRTRSQAPEELLNALDCGADGVLIPHIRTVAEASACVAAAHYGPGGRGYAGSSRAAGYGTTPMAAHRRASAGRTVVIGQIEDAEALPALDAIASVEGLDGLFIGRIDLTVSIGAEDPDDPQVLAAAQAVIDAARGHTKPIGMFVPRDGDVPMWRDRGVTLFLQGSDHSFLRAGAAATRQICVI